jgi:hypothetical protein
VEDPGTGLWSLNEVAPGTQPEEAAGLALGNPVPAERGAGEVGSNATVEGPGRLGLVLVQA